MDSGIYKIENSITGQIYIGSSTSIPFRWRRHRYHLKHNIHNNQKLQRSYNKYGADSFCFTIVELCEPDKLFEKEQYWIDKSHPYYNVSLVAGSILGFKHSEETKEKIRNYWINRFINMSVEDRKKWGDRSRGKLQSEKVRKERSERFKREKYWEKTLELRTEILRNKLAKSVLQFDKDGKLLNEFAAIRDAAKFIGIDYKNCSQISKACSGKAKSAQGFIWKYKNN